MHRYVNPLYTYGVAITSGIINSFGRPIIYIKGYHIYCIWCLKIFFNLNSVDPDEMPHYVAFHLGPHLFVKVPISGLPVLKGLIT